MILEDQIDPSIISPPKKPEINQQISQRMPVQAQISKLPLPQDNLVFLSIDPNEFKLHSKND
jgi:hypothetical protein